MALSEKDTLACFFIWGVVTCRYLSFGAAFYHGIGVEPCGGVVEIVRYAEIIASSGDRRLSSPFSRRKPGTATTNTMFSEERTSMASEQGKVKLLCCCCIAYSV